MLTLENEQQTKKDEMRYNGEWCVFVVVRYASGAQTAQMHIYILFNLNKEQTPHRHTHTHTVKRKHLLQRIPNYPRIENACLPTFIIIKKMNYAYFTSILPLDGRHSP